MSDEIWVVEFRSRQTCEWIVSELFRDYGNAVRRVCEMKDDDAEFLPYYYRIRKFVPAPPEEEQK